MSSVAEPLPEPQPEASPGRRFWGLDVLRAIAVLLVLGRHVVNTTRNIPPALGAVLQPWKRCGWIGVDLFFVLSGFLVSGLLFAEYRKHGTLRPLRFLGRRGFKIYPAFYLFLLVTWLWKGDQLPGRLFLYEGLFIQNYTAQIWGHTWSLAIEEHFYLALALGLWALVCRATGPDPFRWLPRTFLIVAATALALRVRAYANHPSEWLLLPTHLRVDGLSFGAVIAYGWTFHRERLAAFAGRHRLPIAGLSLLLVAPCVFIPVTGSFFVNTVGLTTNYLGFGGIILLTVAAGERPSRWERLLAPLARLGFYSYSIYLWHMAVRALTTIYLPARIGWSATLAVYFAGSLVLGVLAARLIELPFLRLRERLLPSRA